MKFIFNPKIQYSQCYHMNMHIMAKNLNPLLSMFPAKVKQGVALPFCFSSHTVTSIFFMFYLVPLFNVFVFFIGDFTV